MVPRFGGAFRPALGADKGEPGTDRIRTHLGKAAELGTGRFRTGDPESVVAAEPHHRQNGGVAGERLAAPDLPVFEQDQFQLVRSRIEPDLAGLGLEAHPALDCIVPA